MIIAVAGSGGKTTLIKELAEKYRKKGKSVFVTTTTHMLIEEDTMLDMDAEALIGHLDERGYLMAGCRAEEQPDVKFTALPEQVYEKVCSHADVVLVESDGSKRMPLKFPNGNEPIIPENVDEIIVVCGLQGLGRPAGEVCHRIELVKDCLGISENTVITPSHVQKLVEDGYMKPLRRKFPGVSVKLHVTHDNSLYQRTIAALLEQETDVSFLREEWFMPQPKLIICGGGHVSKEVAEFASGLDFYVKVIDDRPELVTKERFPTANEVICDSFENLKQYLDEDAYYVVVTPNHAADYECVKTILPTSYRYLGMIGSKTKVAKTRQNLMEDGFTQDKVDSVFAPIGLAIGAVTPAEIAISILAQIIQIKNVNHASSADAELLTAEDRGVLCIVTEKHGSAPRGEGSMMLVGEERILGSIGGGQAEYLAVERAKDMKLPEIKVYDLNVTTEHDPGMICGGVIKVMFIPLQA